LREKLVLDLEEQTHCGHTFATHEAARMAIVSYIERFYNRKRLHQTLDYRVRAAVDDEAISA